MGRRVVLDPFMGSGTTALVARSLGRRYVGIELNPDYIDMAERRLAKTGSAGRFETCPGAAVEPAAKLAASA